MIKYLFLDLDDTILDFQKTEEVAIQTIFSQLNVPTTRENIECYRQINLDHWHRLERGELTMEQVKFGCFQTVFSTLGITGDPIFWANEFERLLGVGHYFLPGAEEAVHSLAKKYDLFLVSNGSSVLQRARLKSAGIDFCFTNCFVSQDMGVNKPHAEFFERTFAQIPDFDTTAAMIVGDSLTSDIQGGKNAGIATCWLNPRHKPAVIQPDYEIEALFQLEALLEAI